jgi:hypothetical protein
MMMFENRNNPPTIRFSVTRLTRMYRRNAAAKVISRRARRFHSSSQLALDLQQAN